MFKEIKKIKNECPVCEVERDLIYGLTDDTLKVRNEEITVTSKIYYCPEGNHYFYDADDENDKFESAYNEYRKRKGLLQPEEIRQIREQYGLSQRNFALLLGWGEITIHRYESGAIQDEVHNDVLSMIRLFEDFSKYFHAKKHLVEPDLARKVEEKIKEIEKERNHRTFDMLIKFFNAEKKEPTSLNIEIKPVYSGTPVDIEQDSTCQHPDDRELALAA